MGAVLQSPKELYSLTHDLERSGLQGSSCPMINILKSAFNEACEVF